MKKTISLLITLVVILTSIAWSGPVLQKPASADAVTVTFWKAPHSEKEAEIWKGIIADFEAQNPGIKIEHVITPWDTWDEKFTSGFASDTPPDVSYMVDWWSAKYALNNQFVDLDKAGWSADVKGDYDASVWAIPNIGGKQYGVPILLVPRLMFYNKDLFKEAGVAEPTNAWTWKDFLDVSKKLTKNDQYGFVFPATFAGRGYQDYLAWLYSAGGQILSDDGTKAALNSAGGKESLQYIVDLFKEKVVPPSGQYDDVSQEDLFMRGKVGMAVMRALSVAQIRKDFPNLHYGLVLPPKGSAGQFTFADWGFYAVAERSQHKEESWKWVKYITSKDVAARYLKEVGLFPARKDTGLFLDDPEYKLFVEYTPYAKGIPIHPKIQEVFQIFWSEAEKAILGTQSVEDTLSASEKLVNEALGK